MWGGLRGLDELVVRAEESQNYLPLIREPSVGRRVLRTMCTSIQNILMKETKPRVLFVFKNLAPILTIPYDRKVIIFAVCQCHMWILFTKTTKT